MPCQNRSGNLFLRKMSSVVFFHLFSHIQTPHRYKCYFFFLSIFILSHKNHFFLFPVAGFPYSCTAVFHAAAAAPGPTVSDAIPTLGIANIDDWEKKYQLLPSESGMTCPNLCHCASVSTIVDSNNISLIAVINISL